MFEWKHLKVNWNFNCKKCVFVLIRAWLALLLPKRDNFESHDNPLGFFLPTLNTMMRITWSIISHLCFIWFTFLYSFFLIFLYRFCRDQMNQKKLRLPCQDVTADCPTWFTQIRQMTNIFQVGNFAVLFQNTTVCMVSF